MQVLEQEYEVGMAITIRYNDGELFALNAFARSMEASLLQVCDSLLELSECWQRVYVHVGYAS